MLAPVEATAVGEPVARGARGHRRRRLIVDSVMLIPSEMIKRNISSVDDVIRHSVDLAPPTKQLMACKEFSSVDKMFTSPGCHLASSRLLEVQLLLILLVVLGHIVPSVL